MAFTSEAGRVSCSPESRKKSLAAFLVSIGFMPPIYRLNFWFFYSFMPFGGYAFVFFSSLLSRGARETLLTWLGTLSVPTISFAPFSRIRFSASPIRSG